MASVHSDPSSSEAPSEFPLSSDEDLLEKNEGSEKCPLCRSLKKHFYCVRCVRAGDFYSSSCTQRETSHRFVEKKLALLRVKGEIQEMLAHSDGQLAERSKIFTMRQEIRNTRERISLLKKWRDRANQSLAASNPILEETKASTLQSRQQVAQLEAEIQSCSQQTEEDFVKMKLLTNQLELARSQLKDIVRENVQQLMRYIFPITCEGHPCEEDSESMSNVKDALADASQTAYVRGQWIYSDSGHHGQYRIVGAALPGAGDMNAYQLCVSQAEKGGDYDAVNHFKVALSHTTQLTHLLAFYLGVRLPKRLKHLDFIRTDLDVRRFSAKVGRLHANVLYLCTSQGVAPVHLRHANPLARLLTLLDSNICDLGRHGPFEFPSELWSFEEAIEDGESPVSGTAASSPCTSDEEEEDSDLLLNADWESVAGGVLPIENPAGQQSSNSPASSSGSDPKLTPVSGSVVGGVVSSVASLWKAWPWTTK